MICFAVLLPLVALSAAQRPTYAGTSSKGYPGLASRFGGSSEDQAAPVNTGLANRIGDQDVPTPKIPSDARGDVALVNRLNQWPRENRPFWLLNSDHIEKHRYPGGQLQQGDLGNQQPQQQSSTLRAVVMGGGAGQRQPLSSEDLQGQQAGFVEEDDDFDGFF